MARSQSEFGRHGVLDVDRLVGNFEGVVFGGVAGSGCACTGPSNPTKTGFWNRYFKHKEDGPAGKRS